MALNLIIECQQSLNAEESVRINVSSRSNVRCKQLIKLNCSIDKAQISCNRMRSVSVISGLMTRPSFKAPRFIEAFTLQP